MPGVSYEQIEDLFRRGTGVLGRPWGRLYDQHLGSCHGCCETDVGSLMPDCSDYCVEAGYAPPRPCPPASQRPARRAVRPPRIIG